MAPPNSATVNGAVQQSTQSKQNGSGPETMPLAIVGMACRFAGGISSPEKLWDFVSKGKSAWSTIPEKRFNRRASYESQHGHGENSHIRGGYFLEEDIALFDTSFFNLSAEVAASMDPQLRILLELTFESLESAGIPIEEIAGSKTAVFAGTFSKDYHDRMLSDPLHIPRNLITGNYAAMIANRISHFFDLKGPSSAVDTGCSTSLIGLHLACQSLRSGESDCAVVGGAALHLSPDMFGNLSNLGTCGPEGKCYAFDHRAQGYGRGEGAAILIVKRLEDALRSNDPIRAVIRETAVNQDGKTATITLPDGAAQQDLIRECYERAGLDPRDTAVVEAHGTGTIAGDPIEAKAIGRSFRWEGTGPSGTPVLIASVKTNLGHTEAASGLAALIKMAKSVEYGQVAPSLNFERANPSIDLDALRLEVPLKSQPWPANYRRRASINNFGYGGTNAHVIIEAAPKASSHVENGVAAAGKDEAPRILVLSARDENGLLKMASNLCEHLVGHPNIAFKSLAFTLGQRRSRFPWSLAVSSSSLKSLISSLSEKDLKPVQALGRQPRLGYVFNGQGAQWFAMGRELMATYPAYLDTLMKCEEAIRSFGGTWSLIDELKRDGIQSRVDQVQFSLPLTCAVQIALVHLLADWGVKPTAVTGHSTGEVAAAYSAGGLSLEEAIAITFFRGMVNSDHIASETVSGSMMAVGLSPEEVKVYLDDFADAAAEKVTIACFNSPSSVTLSGDTTAIERLEQAFKSKGVFARKLKVQAAFHSHHMVPLAEGYGASLEKHMESDKQFLHGSVTFFSSTTGSRIEDADQLSAAHWVENMLLPVQFTQSLGNMLLAEDLDFIVEVGAHAALAGPIRQIVSSQYTKDAGIPYESCLHRGKDAVTTAQTLAGKLLQYGYPVDISRVNFPRGTENLTVVPDLPSYPWNHATRFWTEPRISREQRFRKHPPHELLGVRQPGLSGSPIWRLVLRTADLPWMRDHVIQSKIVYPGSGYITMAIEAVRQLYDSQGKSVDGYLLRQVEILKALVVPDNAEGVEVQLSLEPVDERSLIPDFHRFRICSAPEKDSPWEEIASGLICAVKAEPSAGHFMLGSVADKVGLQLSSNDYNKRMRPRELYDTLHGLGVRHGPAFRNIEDEILQNEGRALTKLIITDSTSATAEERFESHVIHPTTLDTVFQGAYPCLSPSRQKTVGTAVPRSIKSLFISSSITCDPGSRLQASAVLLHSGKQGFNVSTAVHSAHSKAAVIEIEDMHFQSLGHISEEGPTKENMCLVTDWKRSFLLNDARAFADAMRTEAPEDEKILGKDLVRSTVYMVSDALKQLTSKDLSALAWHHKRLHGWILQLEQQAANDELAPRSSRWASSSPGVKQMHIDKTEKASVAGALSVRIGKNLVRILRNQVAPLELMMQGELLYEFYQSFHYFKRSTAHAASFVRGIAEENPRVRILEIGAGTGGCTLPVLQALSSDVGEAPLFEHYDFTDISQGFLTSAREKMADWGDRVSYRTLDIEKDPIDQGFEAGSYDIIIAAQVLHAVESIDTVMQNVKKLLKEEGKLVLVETTRDTPEVQLIFGTLPGWWLGEEPERRSSPNMSLESWDMLLAKSGFTGLEAHVWDCEDEGHQSMSCILSSLDTRMEPALEGSVNLLYHGTQPPSDWLRELTQAFRKEMGISLIVGDLSSVEPEGKVCAILSGVGGPAPQFDETTFESLRSVITKSKGLFWITRGSTISCEFPENASHVGLLRTAQLEDTSKRYISLDLDPSLEPWSSSHQPAILSIFKRAMNWATDVKNLDTEYAVRKSEIFVPRVCVDNEENETLMAGLEEKDPAMKPFDQSKNKLRMHVDTPGLLDSIVFRHDPDAELPLAEDYVEIEPRAFGLAFHDVMDAMGMLKEDKQEMGMECAGVITRVGPRSTIAAGGQDLQVGDRVAALTAHGHIASTVRTPRTSVVRIPPSMSFKTAASFVTAMATAYYSLFEAGRCESGDTVLIHAGSGGVGQACIILAQWKGIEVFVTAGTEEKRAFLESQYSIPSDHLFSSRNGSFAHGIRRATGGRGVDVVINSLAGNLLNESWNLVATHGRFVEIGKRDVHLNKSLEMEPFRRGLSFVFVDLIQLADNKGLLMQRILQEVLRLLANNTIRNITPVAAVPLSEAARAFRTMQAGNNIGKIVLVPTPNEPLKVIEPLKHAQLCPDASYMIVGGLSGVGQSIARYFISKGARNLLLVSRSAASRSNNSTFTRELAAGGAIIVVKDCDISDGQSLRMVLDEWRTSGMPEIKGVVHGGMMLDDSILERMSFSQWNNALNPKVRGTKNIADMLGPGLDFLILLSSLSGLLGNRSQANYAAGNTYQDAMARHLSAKGLPCVAIDLSVVDSVGIVANSQDTRIKERLQKEGFRPLSEADVLGLVDYAIRNPRRTPRTSQIATGVSRTAFVQHDRRFSMLQGGGSDSRPVGRGSSQSGQASVSIHEEIARAGSLDEAASAVQGALVEKISSMFVIPEKDIDPGRPLSHYGVDSLVAVEMRNWLVPNARVEISIFDLIGSSSLSGLALNVVKRARPAL
ncbi:polyketide synthase-3 [Diaporthe helianthi]|uniref:Polyketide synthase-3 n=1 Tax=Diaporthe helianthi TaxID=158607 RepID=A0A2P5HV73_DIAHE|nr:polyketide synthase-3 [Diaporthe helianthi]